MIKIFTFYGLRLMCLPVFFACLLIPQHGKTQKKAAAYLANPVVYINLMLPSADTLLLVDGTGALYANKYSAGVDENDAGKLSNVNENICLFRDRHKLAIETRPLPNQTDTLFIRMWGMVKQNYSLQIAIKGIPLMLPVNAWLVDNYLHTQAQINLFSKTLYNFTRDADTNTYINRFMIVFDRRNKQENNQVNTSSAVQLKPGNVSVYPNPVAGSRLSLHFMGMPKDNYIVKLRSLRGETLSSINIMHAGNDNEYYLSLNSVYIQGIYTITISGKNTGKTIHLPVVINR